MAKKKRSSYIDSVLGGTYEDALTSIAKKKKKKNEDSDYVKSVMAGDYKYELPATPKKTTKKSSKWADSLDDGYDFGDLTKTILGKSKEGITSLLDRDDDIAPVRKTTGTITSSLNSLSKDELLEKRKDLQKQLTGYDRKEKREWWDKDDNVLENVGNVLYKAFAEKQDSKYVEDKTYNSLAKQLEEVEKLIEDKTVAEHKYSDGLMGFIEKSNDTIVSNFTTGTKGITTTTKKILGQEITEEDYGLNLAERLGQKASTSASNSLEKVLLDVEGGVARMIPQMAIGNPTGATIMGFANYGGGAYNEARQDGYTDEQATKYGITIGSLEMAMTKALGSFGEIYGSSKLGKASQSVIDKFIPKIISNKQVRQVLSQFGSEGIEEFLQEYTGKIVKDTLLDEKGLLNSTWENITDTDLLADALYSGFIGGITGAALDVPNAIARNNYEKTTGRNADTGYTQNEQTVIDSLVEEQSTEIAKQQAIENEINKAISSKETEQGGSLSAKEKTALTEAIKNKIEAGEIDVSNNKLSNKEISKIRKEIEEKLEKGQLDTTKIDSILGDTLTEQDALLSRSYEEQAKKGQNFTYDTNKVTDAQEKAVYESAAKYFNDTTRSHEFVEKVAKISKDKGTNYGFINNEELSSLGHDIEGKQVNGLVRTSKDGKQTVLINIDSPKALNTIVGHETTHLLEGTQEYTDLQEAIFNYAKEKGDFNDRQSSLQSLYEGIENANIDSELTAALVGDYLFTDEKFIDSLSTQKPTVFQKVKELIDDLVVRFKGTKEEKALREVQKKFKEAYKKNTAQIESDTKYSLSNDIETMTEDDAVNTMKRLSSIEETRNLSADEQDLKQAIINKYVLSDKFAKYLRGLSQEKTTDNNITPNIKKYDTKQSDIQGLENYKESDIEDAIFKHIENKISEYGYDIDVDSIYLHGSRKRGTAKIDSDLDVVLFYNGDADDVDLFNDLNEDRLNIDGVEVDVNPINLANESANDYIAKSEAYDKEVIARDNTNPTSDADIRYSLSEDTKPLEERVFGDDLLDAQDLIEDVKSVGGEVDNNGYVTVYHQTTTENANKILETGKMTAKEFGVFFSTSKNAQQSDGRGTTKLEFKIPAEKLLLDDIFDDNVDVKIPLNRPGEFIDVSDYLVTNKNNTKNSLSQQNEIAPKNPNLTYGEDVKLQIAPLQEEIKTLTETVQELKEQIAPVQNERLDTEVNAKQTEIEYTQPTKAELDNLMALQKTGGTEYANTFFGLRDKYGQAKLYKGINEYKKTPDTYEAPIKGDEFAPITEADLPMLEQQYEEDFKHIDESSMPNETDEIAPDVGSEVTTTKSLFETRDYEDVGNRKVNAYQYDNPEVKPFFQEEAQAMLGDLKSSIKGERSYNDQLYYDTGGEQGFYGTERQTTSDIAELLDGMNGKYKYSYADIEKGLNAIIKDEGSENNAVSKRIEFYLDQRLREGYTTVDGIEVPANQQYIELLESKEITDYYNNIPITDDMAPMENVENSVENVSNSESIAPIKVEKLQKSKGRVTQATEPELINGAKQLTIDGTEEDLSNKKITRKEIHANYINNIKNTFAKNGYDFDKVLDNATKKSTFSSVDNTPQRFIEKSLGYKEGQILNDLTIDKTALNESKAIKWLNSFTNRKTGELAKISKQYNIKPGSKESAAAQMYGEGFYVNDNNELVTYGDKELAQDFPNEEVQRNIKRLAKDPRIRQIYDETLESINESRVRNGYAEIPRRNNYFLHFRAMEDTFSQIGLPFNPNDIKAKDLPTDMAAIDTASLRPGQPYFASANRRTGNKTSYDLLGGLERYLGAAKNQIYHIDDIQVLRALRNYVADRYGQAKGLENLDMLSDAEAEERIKQVYNAHLSSFAKFLNEQANVLAGKTTLIDRGLEGIIGRRGITTLDTINSQVGKNMVGFNFSSPLTNFIGAVQGFAKTGNKFDAIKSFAQMTSNKISSIFGKSDGFAENDPTIIRRQGIDRFYRTPYQKVSDVGYVLMSGVDDLTTEFLVRTKYNELTRKGMNSEQAHIEAGKWTSKILGDRSLGQQPHLYNSKMLGLFTKFQLEVRNQLDSQFYDTIQEANASTEDIQNGLRRNATKAAKITSTMVQLAVFQHLFGKAFESMAGYNPTFDIVEVLIKALGFDDEEESEDTPLDNIEEAFLSLLEDLPYASTFTGGRIPIESALPIEQLVKGQDDYGNEKSRWETIREALPYYVLPGGYNQAKKTYQGLSMFDDDLPVSGSYTKSGNLRFPVEDTLNNRIQAGLFGQWASENARTYFDEERAPLKEKQINEYAELDLPIREYWDYRDGLKGLNTLEEKFEYVNDLNVTTEQKNIMINNIVDRKEEVDMSNYDDFGSYDEFDFAIKNQEKYDFLQENNISYSDYIASDESKEAYNWAYNNPEKYALSKTVTDDVVTYRRYKSDIYDIEADKDSSGESIKGSRKEKVISYVNSLDLSVPQKAILIRQEYSSYRDYNNQIVKYVDNLDIAYEEKVAIFEELDMTVKNGRVYWD